MIAGRLTDMLPGRSAEGAVAPTASKGKLVAVYENRHDLGEGGIWGAYVIS
jgi:hypothetical protein